MGAIRSAAAVLILLGGLAKAAVAAPEPQRLIGPGDPIADFGRIGGWGFTAHGLDDAGRLLIQRDDTSTPPLWADEHGLVSAVDAPTVFPLRLEEHIDVHPNGTFVFTGRPTGDGPNAVYAVIDRELRRIATVGDRDPAGATLCVVNAPRINAAGAVVFGAAIASPGISCEPPNEDVRAAWSLNSATYLATAGGLQRMPRTGGVLALTEDSRVVFDNGDVVGADGATTAAPDLRGPSGEPIAVERIYTANRRGTLLFWGRDGGRARLYRGDANGVAPLLTAGDPAPWGGTYTMSHVQYPTALSIDDAGDVLVVFNELRAVLYPAGGAARRIDGYALGGAWLNDRGQLALLNLAAMPGRLEGVRWQGDRATRLVASGDQLPDGSYLLNQGLTARCVGPDGSVAVVGDAVPSAHGLLCIDAGGTHPVVRRGDGTPAGRRFYTFESCAIPRPGEILFVGDRLLPYDEPGSVYANYSVEPAIYRATATALERVIGPGDRTDDGSTVAGMQRLSTFMGSFFSNGRGDVLAVVALNDPRSGEIGLVLREAGGVLRRLPLPLGRVGGWGYIGFPPDFPLDHEYLAGLRDAPLPTRTPAPAAANGQAPRARMGSQPASTGYAIHDAVLLDSGEALLLVDQTSDPWSATGLLVVDANGIIATLHPDDPVFAGSVQSFDAVRAAGDWIVLQTRGRAGNALYGWHRDDVQPIRLFGSNDGTPNAPARLFSLRGVTADGRVYFDDYIGNRAAYRAWQDGVFQTVADFPLNQNWLTDVAPTGTLLLQDSSSSILLLGDRPSGASCPVPPTLVLPTLTVTPTPTITPTVTATRTATPTRTGSPTRSATPAPQCDVDAAACLRVGTVSGVAGQRATVEVRLDAPGVDVAATQNDLRLPDGMQWGDCAVDAAINRPDSAFRVIDGDRVRALVLAFEDLTPIADGATLYRCTIAIDAQVAAGRYALACSRPGASTPNGSEVATACSDAEIDVAAAPPPATATASATATVASGDNALGDGGGGGMGCAVTPGASADSAWWLGLAALLAWRRRASRR
ncbi:MAG: hypothetical protein SF182_11015 [Deltaproteobacteria bacterium]|nr:hypothetical protein [Deltaproteobacteria bacterium]